MSAGSFRPTTFQFRSWTALEVAADQGYAAVELPYAGGRFSALLVEPSGSMKHWLAGLSAGEISTITS